MLFCFCLMHINWGHSLRTAKIIRVTYWGSCAPASSVLVCVCVCARVHARACLCVCLHEGPKVAALLSRTSWPWSVLPHWKSPTRLRGLLSLQVGLPGQAVDLRGSFQRLGTITTFIEPWGFSGLVSVIRRKLPSDASSLHHIIWP